MNHTIVFAGIVLILIGMLVVVIGSFMGKPANTRAEWGIGGFIGPIPFGFASNKGMLYIVMGILILLVVMQLFLR